jgi:hypothetical protein
MKPILCLDFDGVIHSYTSGWKGPRTIPDDPVPGALEFILEAVNHFEVHIFSSRSNYWFGRWAMKRWLKEHLVRHSMVHNSPSTWYLEILTEASATWEPWPVIAGEKAHILINMIKWPKHKPAAAMLIDDRAMTFTGDWPTISEIKGFKPWNKRAKPEHGEG